MRVYMQYKKVTGILQKERSSKNLNGEFTDDELDHKEGREEIW